MKRKEKEKKGGEEVKDSRLSLPRVGLGWVGWLFIILLLILLSFSALSLFTNIPL